MIPAAVHAATKSKLAQAVIAGPAGKSSRTAANKPTAADKIRPRSKAQSSPARRRERTRRRGRQYRQTIDEQNAHDRRRQRDQQSDEDEKHRIRQRGAAEFDARDFRRQSRRQQRAVNHRQADEQKKRRRRQQRDFAPADGENIAEQNAFPIDGRAQPIQSAHSESQRAVRADGEKRVQSSRRRSAKTKPTTRNIVASAAAISGTRAAIDTATPKSEACASASAA